MPFNIYEPRTMGRVIERMPKTKTFLKDTFFKRVETFMTESVDIDLVKGGRELAPFVHKNQGGTIVELDGYQTNVYTPPLISPLMVTKAGDLQHRLPGETLYNGFSPEERATRRYMNEARELDKKIARREEWMCAKALVEGSIPILDKTGKAIQEKIDFGFTNKITLKGDESWKTSTSKKYQNLLEWREQVQKEGFVNADICIMGQSAAVEFLQDESIQKMLDTKAYDIATIKPRELANGATYIGTIHSLGMDIYTYVEWYLDNWSNKEKAEYKKLIPDNTVILASSQAEYSMLYGAIAVLDEQGKRIGFAEGIRVPDCYVERNPVRHILQLSSAPLPVPHEVNSWLTAKVM